MGANANGRNAAPIKAHDDTGSDGLQPLAAEERTGASTLKSRSPLNVMNGSNLR